MDCKRAILAGIDSARSFRKNGESEWHDNHPLFRYWWEAVVMKADFKDFSEQTIIQQVMKRIKRK